jgi:phosphoribosyl-ATP pyrophosphohydrolase/phosphoribosyl-AMP cyclohydrolase
MLFLPKAQNTNMESDIIEELWAVIKDRKENPKEGSYTNKLLNNEAMIFRKLEEELAEIEQAAKDGCCGGGKDSLQWESADFIYHLLVLIAAKGVELDDVLKELKSRR